MLKIYFNRCDEIDKFNSLPEREESILVFGFNGVDKINYKKESERAEKILKRLRGI